MPSKLRAAISVVLLFGTVAAFGAVAPVVSSFTATPVVPVPGQSVVLQIAAVDPDCTAPPCTSACGTAIRSDLLVWTDDSGRTSGAFSVSTSSPTGSPWNASVTWIAPPADGTYTVRANVVDNGGMLCGGRKTTVATLQINVSSVRPPSVSSCTVTPQTLAAGATATIAAEATDPLGRALTFAFSADAGTITHAAPESSSATWTAPQSAGNITLRCTAIAGGVSATLQATASVELGAFERRLETPALKATRMAALPDGRLVAVDGTNGVLALLSTTGGVAWRARGLRTPVAIAVAGEELFVLERGAHRVSVWTKSGARVREFALKGVSLPNDLAAGPAAEELAIADSGSSRVVVISSRDGAVRRVIGSGMLVMPAALAMSGSGIAVADAAAGRVLLFDAGGTLQSTLGDGTALIRPQGVAWDAANRRLIVADSYSGELVVLGEENAVRGSLAGFGTTEGKLVNPLDVTLAGGGILVATTASGETSLYRLTATLQPLAAASSLTAADRPHDDGGAISLTWTASPDDPARVTSYRIERTDETGESFTIAGTAGPGVTTFVDGTAGDVCVRYRVVATDGASDAPSNVTPCAYARNDLAPPAPAQLFAAAESPTRATIEWSAVSAPDLAGYLVELTAPTLAPMSRSVTATSIALAELAPGTEYTVTVRAFDTANNVSTAAATRVTTYEDAPPATPVSVTATDVKSGGTLEVRWSAPASSIPTARYRVTATPAVDGWPSRTIEVTSAPARLTGLVNQLPVRVSVIAVAPWDRESDAATAAEIAPTAPLLPLPLVAETDEVVDAAGRTLQFETEAEKRELRLQYRADGTTLQVAIDGSAVASLPDTGGAWTDASIAIEKKLLKAATPHLLELRSGAFPTASARLALRRVDLVPLAPRELRVDSFNTVADIVWTWDEPRAGLGVILTRDGAPVVCSTPQAARCRDTFLANGTQRLWTLRAASPAGWLSEAVEQRAHAKFSETPPPVTDLAIVERDGGLELTWTPLSSAPKNDAPPAAVKSYRIYANGAFLAEVAAPPVIVRDVDAKALVVRSVDADGKESP